MNIDLELYRVFAAVVRSGSFSAAAKELFITQPAVSQGIRQLEENLGTALFIRGAKGATLTREGELLYGYASSALNLIDSGEKRISQLKELSGGELRIGASDTISKCCLLPVVKEFHDRYPDVVLRITNRTSRETLQLLRDGMIDIGFINMPISAQNVIFEQCIRVHDVFIAGESFSFLRGRELELAEIAALPLIMLEQAANSRRWVDRHFLSNGVELRPQIELGAHDLLMDYARIGLGIACCIREFVDLDESMFELNLREPVESRSIGACYLDGIALSPAARRFIDLVKS